MRIAPDRRATIGELCKYRHGVTMRTYWPALDGLRGVAILLVLAGHIGLFPARATVGPAGVDVFFVLSGFLITNVITNLEGGLRQRLLSFYGARVARLMPAIVLTSLAITILWIAVGREAGRIIGSALAAVFYVQNFTHPTTEPDALTHTWSLSVEEQFYLLWPFALLLLRRVPGRVRLVLVAMGILVSLVLRVEFSRLGFEDAAIAGLPANAFALLIGCLIALGSFARLGRGAVITGALALIATFVLGATKLPDPNVMVPVGAAFSTGILLLGAVNGNRVLEWRALRYFGTVSYSWYLWHWPLLFILGWVDTPWPGIIAVVAAFLIAVASTKYIEKPIRRAWHRYMETHRGDKAVTTPSAGPELA